MYIVEVCDRLRNILYVHELTETTISLTEDWRKAERFPAADLAKVVASVEAKEGISVIGFDAV
jgi:hypothetical protein